MAPPSLQSQPPPHSDYILSYPAPHVLLITINRPSGMNSLPYAAQWDADASIQWVDEEPTLRAAVITGTGDKAFCAGQDLIEQSTIRSNPPPKYMRIHPFSGFAGISRRTGKKPIIAAVNGWALGGGFEICLGCDMIVAAPRAKFGLPEASRGIYAAAGGLSRLVRLVGISIASEVAMADRKISAQEAVHFGIANKVSKTNESVVDEAVELASRVANQSPDAIIITRSGLREGLEQGSVERASQITQDKFGTALEKSENTIIGLTAFAQKQKPKWVPSKL